jgi:hypothetical protein
MNTTANQQPASANRYPTGNKMLALGGIALAFVGVGVKAVNAGQEKAVFDRIAASGEHAVADYKDGRFEGLPVTLRTVEKGGTTFAAAQEIADDSIDVRPLVDVLQAQTGNATDPKEQFVTPTSVLPKE